jgi:hypothetical protein
LARNSFRSRGTRLIPGAYRPPYPFGYVCRQTFTAEITKITASSGSSTAVGTKPRSWPGEIDFCVDAL